MKKVKIGILSICLLMLAGCSNGFKISESKDNSRPIIKVNESVITQKMYDETLDAAYNSSPLAARNVDLKDSKNKSLSLMFKGKVVNDLIIRTLITQEAEKRNINASDDEVNKAIDKIAQKAGGKDKLEATLTLNNVSKETFAKNIKLDVITNKLVDSLMANNKISDKQVQEFYNENKTTKFTTPDLVRAQHILIAASPEELKAKIQGENSNLTEKQVNQKVQEELNKAKAKAENVLSSLKQNPSQFDEKAKQNSDDPGSAQKGGDLGYFAKENMVPEFSNVAFSLAPGKISDVVKTQFGYHIIKVMDRKKAGIVPFVEVKEEIKKYLHNQEKLAVLQKLLTNLKNTAKIEYLVEEYNLDTIQNEVNAIVKKSADPKQASTK